MICRGLKFAIPKHASSIVFEKAYWKLEPHLPEDIRVPAASTLRSEALNCIHRKGAKYPRTLLKAIHQLKKRDDILITKLDKGTGVVAQGRINVLTS